MTEQEFKPCYVWPNPAFPFRVFYSDNKVRIFIIENLGHNYGWLKQIKNKIKKSDYFFVILGCYYHNQLVVEAEKMIDALGLSKEQFRIMYNDDRDKALFEPYHFLGDVINHNCWLDETKVMMPLNLEKKYDAIYVARLIAVKRHHLASDIVNLALVAGLNYGTPGSDYAPPHTYVNDVELSPNDVCIKINESVSGLILSDVEGASFVSSEYLLCGIPVVSTISEGGRAYWYDEYNSLVVEPTPQAVKKAVEFFKQNPRDPYKIRESHIKLALKQRERFVLLFSEILQSEGVDYIDAKDYFNANYFHKMRTCYTVPIHLIFE